MRKVCSYRLSEVAGYINWIYFFHAWEMNGKPQESREALRQEALALLRQWETQYQTHAVFALFDAWAEEDDIWLGGTRLPMLRQQRPGASGACLSLADFVQPRSMGKTDRVGAFAATVDAAMEKEHDGDDYRRMLAQTLADRLAEATVERLHLEVRRQWWGYAPDEQLSVDQLLREEFQGIRPAVGYPSLPDTSINFLLSELLGMKEIGIYLTENGAMRPHASVSGLMIAHPQAHYFDLGPIGEDQLADYARRRGVPVAIMRRFLASSLIKR